MHALLQRARVGFRQLAMTASCHAGITLAVLLAGLVNALAAKAASPPTQDAQCAALIDQHWSAAEKFVWKNLCVGNDANFNFDANFGGGQDPKSTEGLPESRTLTPDFLKSILLNDKYRNKLNGHGVRVIGARFMTKLDLQNEELEHGLRLAKSQFDLGADLSGLKSKKDLDFSGSKFTELSLARAHIDGQLRLSGAKVDGKLDMESLSVGQSLLMTEEARFSEVKLINARIGVQLILENSRVSGRLEMNGLRVERNLQLMRADLADVVLSGARIGRQLDLTGSTVHGRLDCILVQVDEIAYLGGEKARFEGLVRFELATVKGNLRLDQAHFDGEVNLRDARIGGQLNLAGGSFEKGALNFSFAQIGGRADFTGAHFFEIDGHNARIESELVMDGVVVKEGAGKALNLSGLGTRGELSFNGSTINREVDLSAAQIADKASFVGAQLLQIDLHEAHIGRHLVLDGAVITKEANFELSQIAARASFKNGTFNGAVDLHNTRIGDRLDFAGAMLKEKLDLTHVQVDDSIYLGNHSNDPTVSKFFGPIGLDGAKIGRALWLAQAEFHAKLSMVGSTIGDELNLGRKDQHWATWPNGGELDLRDSSAGKLVADMVKSWPPRRHLEGFTYRALCSDPSSSDDECKPKAASNSLKTWLAEERTVQQPYEQLAAVLTHAGLHDEAAAVQFESREVEWNASHGLRWLWLAILRYTIGYGYYPWYLAIWAFVLITVGVVWINVSGTVRDNDLEWCGIFYTIDMFLPLVRLEERHYTDVYLEDGEKLYFYFLKIAGFVLGPAGIAGLLAR
jgi:uncharacterized protein YjbI with pentapeptide repeats